MGTKHFHEGELRLQTQTGRRQQVEKISKVMLRDHLIDQHREFFQGLEYIFLGTVDNHGRPYATILTGEPRFTFSSDARTLTVSTGDRTNGQLSTLQVGHSVGVLGLDLSNRRRNRMHGRVLHLDQDSITISVVQSYGNCPKYIALREVSERKAVVINKKNSECSVLKEPDMDLIRKADTFFIASYVQDDSGAPYEGVDISHRGGHPGFISIDSPTSITIPDYSGNYLFNTLGNLLVNPQAALLFIDFETGDQLHLQGQAEIIEDEAIVNEFADAHRLLRVHINTVVQSPGSIGVRWKFVEASPFNPIL